METKQLSWQGGVFAAEIRANLKIHYTHTAVR